ncbi:hypothetical protein RND81_03G197100 [Saponaria officinalis]|uniref:BHLH domain-containing protein n=1 Tax=Saponaria officinalis TaxID=3572 RepID=A0AAW1MBX0_SAPOF
MNQNRPTFYASPPPPPSPPPISRSLTSHFNFLSTGPDTSTQDYEMAELTWENGRLTLHGLGPPRAPIKNNVGGAWTDKSSTLAGGTLESLVNQATHKFQSPLTPIGTCKYHDDLVPLFDPSPIHRPSAVPTTISMAMESLVPNANDRDAGVSKTMMGCSTRVRSSSVAVGGGGVPVNSDWSVSASGSDRWHGVKGTTDDTCEQLRSMTNTGITSASFGTSLDNTTRTVTSDDRDHDSVCLSRPEKRRDKINQRLKTLQKLVPNSNKTDKASMLEEIINHIKQVQSQIQVLSTMGLPSMMTPLAIQQQLLQMSMMTPPMGMGMGLGMGMNMDQMNQLNIELSNIPGMPSSVLNPAAYMTLAATTGGGDHVTPQPTSMVPTDPLATYLASQSQQSVTMDAYNNLAAMYQQLQQQQIPNQGTGNNK